MVVVSPNNSDKGRTPSFDAAIARLAGRQDSVITTWQLRNLGLSRSDVDYRRKIGRLHRIFRGVYAVGHAEISQKARFRAAVMSVGDGAVLSHFSAAIHWEFMPADAAGDPDEIEVPVDVTVARRVRQRDGIRIHIVRSLPRADTTRHRGIPITMPARTALDLTEVVRSERQLTRAVHEAQARRRVSEPQLQKQLTRASGRRNAGRLAAVIADGPTPTDSDLEDLALAFFKRNGFPPPICQAPIAGCKVDFYFPGANLIIEVDGDQFHGTRQARKADARKQARLEAAGHRVMHLNWEQLTVPAQEQQTTTRIRHAMPQAA